FLLLVHSNSTMTPILFAQEVLRFDAMIVKALKLYRHEPAAAVFRPRWERRVWQFELTIHRSYSGVHISPASLSSKLSLTPPFLTAAKNQSAPAPPVS